MSEKIVQLNEEVIKGQLKELVRDSVEETLNELLEAEAQKLTQAARYERNEQRQGYRSGHYSRNLTTTSGDVTLKVPKLKGISFETAIIERYRRRESSVEEALIEMYLAGVSVRRVEDITEALWGSKVSPSTISELNKKAYVHIEDWRNRPLQGGRYPYVYVDGIYLRRNWGGEFENVAILVAIAVNEDGYHEVLGAAEGMKEDRASWVSFFQWLRSTLPGWRETHCGRQMPRYAGGRGRGIPRSHISAVYRPLLPQCFLGNTSLQGKDCGQDAQSDPRPREQESSPAEGQSCGGGTARYEAERGRKEGRRWH